MGEKYLFVDFGPLVLRYLLGDDGVHVFGLFTFENGRHPARMPYGVSGLVSHAVIVLLV